MAKVILVHNSPMWDGSEVRIAVTDLGKSNDLNMGIAHFPHDLGGDIPVIYSINKNLLSCILDEAKELFGLTKTGTHYIKLEKSQYMIIYRKYPRMKRLDELNTSECNDSITEAVRKIFAVREVMAIVRNFPKQLYVAMKEEKIIILTYSDKSVKEDPFAIVLPINIISTYFSQKNIITTLYELFDSPSTNELMISKIGKFSDQLDKIVRRIDIKYLWYVPYVTNRVRSRLVRKLCC